MYCDEDELCRLAIYLTEDYYMRKYKLISHDNKYFKLTNGYKYKIKFNYDQYFYLNYHTFFRGGDCGLNKNFDCDGFIIIYPINGKGIYRDDFLWIIIKADDIINMITNKMYISDEKGLFKSRYKFSIQDILNNGKKLL